MQRNKREERPAAVRGRRIVVWCGVVAAAMCAWVSAGAASAQEGATARVTADRLNLRESCGMEAPVQGVLTRDTEVVLLGQPLGDEGWVRVRDADGREGCVSARYIEVTSEPALASTPDDVEFEERSLEVEQERMEAEEERREAELRAREDELDDQDMATSGAADWGRDDRSMSGYVDLSYGVAWAASDEEEWQTLIDPNAGGGFTDDRITYSLPRGDAFAIGGGVLFGQFGVGLRWSQQTHEDPADIHLFSTFARPPFQIEARARTAPDLEREESAAHLSFVYAPLQGERFQLRLFVGPSYFDAEQDTVDQVFVTPAPRFEITGFQKGTQSDSAVGFHIGADGSWYWGHFGVGLSAYYSRGEVEFRDRYAETSVAIDAAPQDVDVGGTQVLGGVRWRF